MKKADIINTATKIIKRDAYQARVLGELHVLKIDAGMMKYYQDTACGKAFGAMEILAAITGKPADPIYEQAVEEATMDIIKANYDIIQLLDLAGFDGQRYYETITQ